MGPLARMHRRAYSRGYAQGVKDAAGAQVSLVDLLRQIVDTWEPGAEVLLEDEFVMRVEAALWGADAWTSRVRGGGQLDRERRP